MHAVVSRTELTQALQQLAPIVPTKPSIPILAGIRVDAGSSHLTLTAGTVGLLVQYKIQMTKSPRMLGSCHSVVVPGRSLYELIRRLECPTLILETSEDHSITIRTGTSAYRLCGMDAIDYPDFQHAESVQPLFLIPNRVLIGLIQQVAFAVSTSESRLALTGVLCRLDSEILTFVATDGIRLASNQAIVECTSDISGPAAAAIIPGKYLTALSRMISIDTAVTEVIIDDHSILFRSDRMQMRSSLLPGSYPSTENLIPKYYSTEILLDTAVFVQSLERVILLAGASNAVRMQYTPNRTTELSAQTADIGEALETLALLDMIGDPLTIHYNGKYMIEILRAIDSPEVWLRMTGPERPIIVQPRDCLSAFCILTPIRSR
jgi:DNA polymerase III subunit beta